MNDCLVFNHHSLPYERTEQAVDALPEFLRICVRGRSLGLKVLLVDETVDASWFRIELAQGFYFQDWYNLNKNRNNARELLRAFLSIATRQPFFSNADISQGVDLFEVILVADNNPYEALRAAAWHASPLVGFPTSAPWNSTPLIVTVASLDDGGDIQKKNISINNLYSQTVLAALESEIRAERASLISSGKQLLADWSGNYEQLTPCGKTLDQLGSWSHHPSILTQVIESLSVLNIFAAQWAAKELPNYSDRTLRELGLNHEVSGESTTVANDPTLRKYREFWLPAGSKEFFEKHIKLAMGFRIHFFCEQTSRKVYVGYIGPHLPL